MKNSPSLLISVMFISTSFLRYEPLLTHNSKYRGRSTLLVSSFSITGSIVMRNSPSRSVVSSTELGGVPFWDGEDPLESVLLRLLSVCDSLPSF